MNSSLLKNVLLFGGVALVVGVAGVALWQRWLPPIVVADAPAPGPVAQAPADAPVPAPAASAAQPPVLYPLEVAASGPEPLEPRQWKDALYDLLGRRAVLTHLQLDDLPRRIVATVDNLGRSHAPAALWPVNPAEDRFRVETRGGKTVIAADNARRYAPLIALVESVDAAEAVDLYVRMYPELQRAYAQLGFPHSYFNDRLVEVIDGWLALPVPEQPLEVRLTEVKGPIPSARPWVRYELADPALESLPAGQKILLRLGPQHQRRLQAKLAEFRSELMRNVEGTR